MWHFYPNEAFGPLKDLREYCIYPDLQRFPIGFRCNYVGFIFYFFFLLFLSCGMGGLPSSAQGACGGSSS